MQPIFHLFVLLLCWRVCSINQHGGSRNQTTVSSRRGSPRCSGTQLRVPRTSRQSVRCSYWPRKEAILVCHFPHFFREQLTFVVGGRGCYLGQPRMVMGDPCCYGYLSASCCAWSCQSRALHVEAR